MKVSCVEAFDELVHRCVGRVIFGVHADDIAASAYGKCGDMRGSLAEWAGDSPVTFALGLQAEAITEKTAVLASSRRLARAIAGRGEGLGDKAADATVAVGADVTAGKPRRLGARGAARIACLSAP